MSESLQFFPPLNASLNALSGLLLLAGILMIKKGNRRAHGVCMIGAVSASAVFLICYVSFHYLKGGIVTRFPEEFPTIRKFYLAMLTSHTILAVINVPLVVITVVRAAKRQFEEHKRIARWTFPIWLYVSVTGVLVYFMLYQWFPSAAVNAAAPVDPPAGAAELTGEGLVFDSEVFSYEADASEKQFTATFHIRNEGPDPIRITELDTTCTCLSVTADRMKLEPGDESTLTAVFDIAKLSGVSEKSIVVSTDDPRMRRKRLGVEVSVPPIVEIAPTIAEWTVGADVEPREIVFTVLREKPIRILEATSSRGQVTLETVTVEEGRKYRLILTPGSTDDILLGFVSIMTDCELEQHQRMMAYFAVKDGDN